MTAALVFLLIVFLGLLLREWEREFNAQQAHLSLGKEQRP